MGLPLFITPTEPEAIAKVPEKLVASPRSAIRRRPAMGRPRQNPASLRRRLLGSLEYASNRDEAYSIWDHSRRAMEGDNMAEYYGTTREPRSVNTQSTMNNESDGPFMPAVPEADPFPRSEERQRTLQRTRQTRDQLRRMARRHAAPTPPYIDEDADMAEDRESEETHRTYYHHHHSYVPPYISSLDDRVSPVASSITLPPFTSLPNARSPEHQAGALSPRRRVGDVLEPLAAYIRRTDPRRSPARRSLAERADAINQASNETARNRTRLRQARIRQATLDGLGDRNRSLSPDGGAAWDTLLTSITPDPQPPSAGSSFASTSAAAATTSMSSVPSSTNTSMTSARETREPALRDCDLSDVSNTDEEDEEDMYELREFNYSRSRGPYRTYASAVDTPASLASDPEHLDGMHHIISRLAERDEIPETWWASAGLSRNLRREPSS